jgi:hypothetical protein
MIDQQITGIVQRPTTGHLVVRVAVGELADAFAICSPAKVQARLPE